jgi:type IV pilus assembly protein PilM
MLWRGRRGVVAIDIGSSAVKLVELRGGRVVAAGLREVAIRLREGLALRDATVSTIRDLLAETGISTRRAVGIVQGPATAVLRLTLPRMPVKELRQAVRWEAQKALPFPLDGAILAHHVAGEVVDRDGLTKLLVLLAAVEGQHAAEAVGILRAAGLDPAGLTVVPAALARLVQRGPVAADSGQVWTLLDIGNQASHLVFFRGADLQLAREIGTGGRAITEAMTTAVMVQGRRVQLNPDQAEQFKREHGIPSRDEAERQAEGIPLGQIGPMIRPPLDRLLVEIQRSFAYHQEHVGGPPASRVVLSGGTARLRNLVPFLAQRLGVEVEILDPFARANLKGRLPREELAEMASCLAVATGLALDGGRTLDLLPPQIAAARRAAWARLGTRAAAAAAVLIVAGTYGAAWRASTGTERTLAARRAALTGLQPALETLQRLQAERDALAPRLRAYDALLGGGTFWHAVLKELSNLTPRTVTLNELAVTPDGRLKVKGIAFGNGAAAEMILADYLGKLDASPYFSGVDLIGTREREDFDAPALDFEVTSKLP